jgi:DNA gyrase subunit A
VGVVTSRGRLVRLAVLDLPVLPTTATAPNLAGGAPVAEFLELARDETVLALAPLTGEGPALALGTSAGTVKRVTPEVLTSRDSWELISLRAGDAVVGAVVLSTSDEELVFVSSGGQLLHFSAAAVRPQGRAAAGMTGIKLAAQDRAVFFGAVRSTDSALVVTVSGSSNALPGTEAGSVKVTPFPEYPGKGRATGGVRCHRFLKGEDALLLAWVGPGPARAAAASGVPVDLPDFVGRRDGSGTPATQSIAAVTGPATAS